MKKARIHTKYQAEIPAIGPRTSRQAEPEELSCFQIWSTRGIKDTELDRFLVDTCMNEREVEYGLIQLHDSNFDMQYASEMIEEYRNSQNSNENVIRHEEFKQAFYKHEKDFRAIKKDLFLPSLSTVVNYYYIHWKKTLEYKNWRIQQKTKKCKKDGNFDICYTCKNRGQLLCCDTCRLAFHMECLLPPLERVPTAKWSCPQCVDRKLETRKIEKQSRKAKIASRNFDVGIRS